MPSSQPNKKLPDFIVIGRIARAHGVHGALKVEPLTDDPERFKLLEKVGLSFDNETRTFFNIKEVRIGNKSIILSLEGIQDRNEAEKWRRAYLEISVDQRMPLPEGQHYYFEILDLLVKTTTGDMLGKIVDIITNPANDVYVVKSGEKEILIPAIPDVIKNIDTESGVVTIHLLDGLLD
ncbi:MAG: 16S rRNA processing protein RimM [Calditrichaeota bacterium]|nr:16S rRNA processing protein RimM [Calditrichota bacterium]